MVNGDSSRPAESAPNRLRALQSRSAHAESYLEDAIDSLVAAGDPSALWRESSPWHQDGFVEQTSRVGDACNRRLRFLRSSIIFSALGAEAYANGILSELLDPADFEAIDKMTAVEKLLIGPRLGGVDSPLHRGAEPTQTLLELFRARNRLVHAKRNGHGAYVQYVDRKDEDLFGPKRAGKYIQCVADTIAAMEETCGRRHSLAGVSKMLHANPKLVERLVEAVGPRIDGVPREDSKRPPNPVHEAERLAVARTKQRAANEASTHLDADPASIP